MEEKSKFVRWYNRVQKAWANWLRATVKFVFSVFVDAKPLSKEESDRFWNIVAKVVNTGPGAVNIRSAPNAHISNKTLYLKIDYVWHLFIPTLETVLVADPNGNRTNIVGVADDLKHDFLVRLHDDLKFWYDAYMKAQEEE